MKNKFFVLCGLIFVSSYAGALATHGRTSSQKSFSRPLAHPAAARAVSARLARRAGFAAASSAKGPAAAFAKTKRGLTAGDATAPAQFTYGNSRPPVYSDPGNGGTHSVDGGGFVAIDPGRAVDVGRGPGITLGAPDRTTPSAAGGGGSGGSGGSSNGPAFDPSF